MKGDKIQMGELKTAARDEGIDPDQSYENLREAVEIYECKNCRGEYVFGWSSDFCTDGCEVEYINEYHR